MNYTSIIIPFLGGLGMFIYGMQIMAQGLENAAGNKMKSLLEALTKNKLLGVLLGAFITAVIQSSSATTVMVVGFVNAGIMNLTQAMGVIMGANIGTTVTGWLVSSVEWAKFLSPTTLAPIAIMIGVVIMLTGKRRSTKDIASIIVGFGLLFVGISTMSGAVDPLKESEGFVNLFVTLGKNPLLGIIAGALVTAIIQSSSASVGILQSLAAAGLVPFNAAIYIIMGQNIGTCVTAIISSFGANKNAKRTAVVHLTFNIIGTAVWLTVFCVVNGVVHLSFINDSASLMGIAIVHSAFNILCTIILFPFANQLEKLARFIIRDAKVGDAEEVLDTRLMATPSIALEQCKKVVKSMFEKTELGVVEACNMLINYSDKTMEEVVSLEKKVDKYEDQLGTYLVQISKQNLSEQDSREVSEILHIIGDVERISDHSVAIAKSAQEISGKKLKFSNQAEGEITVMIKAVKEILQESKNAFLEDDANLAMDVEAMERVIDKLKHQLKKRHVDRLKKGECTIEHGFVMTDIITSLERISDHCSNIASCVEEIGHGSLDIHAYNRDIRRDETNEFRSIYEKYKEKYSLEKRII